MLTKTAIANGITIKISKGDVVCVEDWLNKYGTNILFRAPVSGVYRIQGNL